MHKFFTCSLAALTTFSGILPCLSISAVTIAVLAPVESPALPVDRAQGRQGARDSRQTGRQNSRARFRGCYAMPHGAVAFRYGGYSYYRVGTRYYYPYMYSGRTVYIDIQVSGGHPLPPPPVGSIDIDIYVR
jgi:hypothetical protein